MTRRKQIEYLLEERPMTGAEIHSHIGGTATAVHRYLCELRRRGVVVATRNWPGSPLKYAMPGAVARPVALNWRASTAPVHAEGDYQ